MASNCLALGNKSGSFCEAVNCERSEQEGKFLFATIWFPDLGFHLFSIGNKSGSFCEAVNCERSEQEGKFLFALLWLYFVVSISITAYSMIMDVALVIETAE